MRQIPLAGYTCIEHGTSGMLPCAWPECENGIKESEFESVLNGDIKRVYVRKKWSSPDGDYYSWDNLELPHWFSVSDVFWAEARRQGLVSTTFPKIVYHYTSLEGLIAIIKTKSVWMTDFGYLNDRQEMSYGFNILTKSIEKILDDNMPSGVENLLTSWKNKIKEGPDRVCIASFSADGDSLSQWRAYGPVALGFSVQSLLLHVEDGKFQNVEYNPEIQEKLILTYLRHSINAYESDLEEGRLDKNPDLYHENDRLLDLVTFFKNPAFESENEYRLAYINVPKVLDAFDLSTPPKSFRVSNGKIVPYVPSTDITLSGIDKSLLTITEIVIGPENDELLKQGIQELLTYHGLDNVEIKSSLVPLRA